MANKKTENTAESPVAGENAAVNTSTAAGTEAKSGTGGSELYTVDDFVAATETLFPNKKERPSAYLVAAAFKVNGKLIATKDEGVRIIKEFMGRKVE